MKMWTGAEDCSQPGGIMGTRAAMSGVPVDLALVYWFPCKQYWNYPETSSLMSSLHMSARSTISSLQSNTFKGHLKPIEQPGPDKANQDTLYHWHPRGILAFTLLTHRLAWVLSHFSHVWLFATLWTIARQAPLSMGFSRENYSSGLPCPPPGDPPNWGIKPESHVSFIGRRVLYLGSLTPRLRDLQILWKIIHPEFHKTLAWGPRKKEDVSSLGYNKKFRVKTGFYTVEVNLSSQVWPLVHFIVAFLHPCPNVSKMIREGVSNSANLHIFSPINHKSQNH